MGAALAQSKQAPVLIGWLNSGSRNTSGPRVAAFKEGMATLGWKEGSDFILEEHWMDGRIERLKPLAESLAAKKPAVIVAATSDSVRAVAAAAPNTPVVQANGGDPVSMGLVKSLASPGGMITGLANLNTEVSGKFLELLLDTVPTLRRVGFLTDPTSRAYGPVMKLARQAIARYSVDAIFAEAARPEEIESALSRLAKDGAQALVMMPSSWFEAEKESILKRALAQRWPVVAGLREFAEVGALLSYGPDRSALYRRAAYYVDRILKGAKPGDLPIEQPTKFEMVVNMKTAKALGIIIPQSILLRADQVIE